MNTKLLTKGGTWTCLITMFMGLPAFGGEPLKLGIQNAPGSNSLSLSWQSETGKTYRVLSKGDINSTWMTAADRVQADSSQVSTYVFPDKNLEIFTIQELQASGAVGGSLMLTNGQVLSGTINVDVSAYSVSNSVQGLTLLDITGGVTNTVDAFVGADITVGTFLMDTETIPTGDRMLQIKVIDDNGYPFYDDVHVAYTDPIFVNVSNDFYLSPESLRAGWMISVIWNTPIKNGAWICDIYDEDTGDWYNGSDYADLNDGDNIDDDGNISVHDWWTPDGQDRGYLDGYDFNSFIVYLTVFPDAVMHAQGPPTVVKTPITLVYRGRTQRRPLPRTMIVCEQPSVIGRRIQGGTADSAFDAVLQSFMIYGPVFDLIRFTPTTTPSETEGWNKLNGPNDWLQYNRALCSGTIACDFSCTHGGPPHLGYTNIDQQVSGDTLAKCGWYTTTNGVIVYTNGTRFPVLLVIRKAPLTFKFADACNSMEMVALLIASGDHQYTLSQFQNLGQYPSYGCGWSGKKFVSTFLSDMESFHAEFIGFYFKLFGEIDPARNVSANTYKQIIAQARYHLNDPTSKNPAASGFDWVGCEDLYPDE